MAKSKKTTSKTLYKVSLKVNGELLQSEGETLEEAIKGLKVENYKTNGTLSVTFGEKTIEKFFALRNMRKLFSENTGFGAEVARASMIKFLKMCLV